MVEIHVQSAVRLLGCICAHPFTRMSMCLGEMRVWNTHSHILTEYNWPTALNILTHTQTFLLFSVNFGVHLPPMPCMLMMLMPFLPNLYTNCERHQTQERDMEKWRMRRRRRWRWEQGKISYEYLLYCHSNRIQKWFIYNRHPRVTYRTFVKMFAAFITSVVRACVCVSLCAFSSSFF